MARRIATWWAARWYLADLHTDGTRPRGLRAEVMAWVQAHLADLWKEWHQWHA